MTNFHTRYLPVLGFFLIWIGTLSAQPQQHFNYQAVARDAQAQPLTDTNVTVRVTLHRSDRTGPVVWQEVHQTQTNPFGLITLKIGRGSVAQSSVSIINNLSWNQYTFYLQVEIDLGDGYRAMGTSPIASIPHAMTAQRSDVANFAHQAAVADTAFHCVDAGDTTIYKSDTVMKGYWNKTPTDLRTDSTVVMQEKVGVGTTSPKARLHTRDSTRDTVLYSQYRGRERYGTGVMGSSNPGDGLGIGGRFESQWVGMWAETYPTGNGRYYGAFGQASGGSGKNFGVYGFASGAGINHAVSGLAGGDSINYGIYGNTYGSSGINWAGYFNGRVKVTDTLYASHLMVSGAKSFRIDHPKDPKNKYLVHYCNESPAPMNTYSGTVQLDSSGAAVVQLPDYFEAVNTDYRYQLTPVGAPMPDLYVAQQVDSNQFKIAGGKPSQQVSWEVTANRNDPYMQQRETKDVVEKNPHNKGTYLHPDIYQESVNKEVEAPGSNNPYSIETP